MILSTVGEQKKRHVDAAKEFRFKRKGKLSTREIIELRTNHRNLTSWMEPLRMKCKEDSQDMVEDMEVETRDKEEMMGMAQRKNLV